MIEVTPYDIPGPWQWVMISEIASTSSGGTPSRADPRNFHGDIPWVKSGELNDGVVLSTEEKISAEALNSSNASVLPAGTVLVAMYGATVGRTGVLGIDAATNQAICAIHPYLSGFSPRFIAAWFIFQRSRLVSEGAGGAQSNINQGIVRKFPFPLAPLNEQHRIVDAIEAQFSRLDAWLETMHKLREQLPRLRASILKAAVEGRLVDPDPDDEPADVLLERILDERRRKWEADYLADLSVKGKPAPKDDRWKAKYVEPTALDEYSLPELPEGWVWATLDQLSSHVTSGSRGWAKYYATDGGLFVRVGNFSHLRTTLDLNDVVLVDPPANAEGERTRLKLDDLLVTITASVGMPAVVDESTFQWGEAYINQHVCLIRLCDGEIAQHVAWVIASEVGQSQIREKTYGQVKDGLNLDDVRSLSVPIPPLSYQQRVNREIEARFSVVDRLQATLESSEKRVQRLRQSILKKAFEGQLVEQDPDEEPASVLLERIQVERQRRLEEEDAKPRPRKERKVSTPQKRKSLYDTLKDAAKPLTPIELFQQAGFTHESIDEFYEELRTAIDITGQIKSTRRPEYVVHLEVSD